jgi:phage tail-like protein
MATLNASKFSVKIDNKENMNVIFFGGARIDVTPRQVSDDDGTKGVVWDKGNVSFPSVTIRKEFHIGETTWMDWAQDVRKAGNLKDKKKSIGVTVYDDSTAAKLEYTLTNAWPISYSHTPLLSGKGSQVIEEITLVVEDVEYKAL